MRGRRVQYLMAPFSHYIFTLRFRHAAVARSAVGCRSCLPAAKRKFKTQPYLLVESPVPQNIFRGTSMVLPCFCVRCPALSCILTMFRRVRPLCLPKPRAFHLKSANPSNELKWRLGPCLLKSLLLQTLPLLLFSSQVSFPFLTC